MSFSYTITRLNNFYKYEDSNGYILAVMEPTLEGVFDTDYFYFTPDVYIRWQDCTSPSGATSAADLISLIQALTG